MRKSKKKILIQLDDGHSIGPSCLSGGFFLIFQFPCHGNERVVIKTN